MDYKHEDGTAVMLKYGQDHQKWYQTLCSSSNLQDTSTMLQSCRHSEIRLVLSSSNQTLPQGLQADLYLHMTTRLLL